MGAHEISREYQLLLFHNQLAVRETESTHRSNSPEAMFVLRVQSVDINHPLFLGSHFFSASNRNPNSDPNFSDRRGIAHLFRSVSHSSLPNPSSRSTTLFVVAVPNSLSYDEFIRSCDLRVDLVSELLFIRNDLMEDRYCVLIKLVDQSTSDGFYDKFNGKPFLTREAELCHILYLLDVSFTESAEIASEPPSGFTELPTCPVCLERLDPDTSGIRDTLCDHSSQCSCVSKWTHMSCLVCRSCQQQDEKPTCSICDTSEDVWVCMICSFVGCGRYREGHAKAHWIDTQHCYSLELGAQKIWDYVGDNYVHRLNQSKADGTLAENSRCMSHSSKLESIVEEYNCLLATELETQRQYYESLLSEAKNYRKSTAFSKAVEDAVYSKTLEIQTQLQKYSEEIETLEVINQNLRENQELSNKKIEEIKEREKSELKLKNERLRDLLEQIRDVTFSIKAQKELSKMESSDDIKGATVSVPAKESSPASDRRKPKKNPRRKRN